MNHDPHFKVWSVSGGQLIGKRIPDRYQTQSFRIPYQTLYTYFTQRQKVPLHDRKHYNNAFIRKQGIK